MNIDRRRNGIVVVSLNRPDRMNAVNGTMHSVSSMVMPIGLQYEENSMRSADHKEAVKAFQEKRKPNFTGK